MLIIRERTGQEAVLDKVCSSILLFTDTHVQDNETEVPTHFIHAFVTSF